MTTPKPCAADPELWFSTTKADQKKAVGICNGCPFKDECGQYALDNGDRWGTWGGLTERDRKKLKNRKSNAAEPAQCGTSLALRRHRNNGETCDTCTAWHTAELEADRRRLLDEAHARGGTVAGSAVHRRLGEPVCAMCRAAAARDCAERRARRNAPADQPVSAEWALTAPTQLHAGTRVRCTTCDTAQLVNATGHIRRHGAVGNACRGSGALAIAPAA